MTIGVSELIGLDYRRVELSNNRFGYKSGAALLVRRTPAPGDVEDWYDVSGDLQVTGTPVAGKASWTLTARGVGHLPVTDALEAGDSLTLTIERGARCMIAQGNSSVAPVHPAANAWARTLDGTRLTITALDPITLEDPAPARAFISYSPQLTVKFIRFEEIARNDHDDTFDWTMLLKDA